MAHTRTASRIFYGIRCALHTASQIWKKTDVSNQITSTAGIIIIGDEILKGQTLDTNSHFITKNLTDIGVKVEKISVIGDNVETISNEVKYFSQNFTYVITTGGIGSTHDDLTYEGIAKAFGENLIIHPELQKIVKGLNKNEDLNKAALKFANVPASAKLTFGFNKYSGRRTLFPTVSVRNVHVFPGIPNFMEHLFKTVCVELFGACCTPRCKMDLYISEKEYVITDCLNAVVARYPNVMFGSYPKYLHSYYNVHITLESDDKEELQKAYDELRRTLPEGCIVEYDKYPLHDSYEKIERLAKKANKPKIISSLKLLEETCKKYQNRPEELCIHLTGEMESVAALHMFHACLRKEDVDVSLRGFCIYSPRILPEVDIFIKEMIWKYTIECEVYNEPVEEAITKMLSNKPNIKAIIIGCPMGDTNSEQLREIRRISSSHHEVEWINVLEGWEYYEVCDFVRSLYLTYCCVSVH